MREPGLLWGGGGTFGAFGLHSSTCNLSIPNGLSSCGSLFTKKSSIG